MSLLQDVSIIVGVFYKYGAHNEGSSRLTRKELKKLIQKEFAGIIEESQDPKTVARTLQLLDVNGDGLVDLEEYLLLIFRVADACLSPIDPKGRVHREGISGRREPEGDQRSRHQRGYGREGKSRDSGWTPQLQSDGRKYCEADPLEGEGERKRIHYGEVEREESPLRDRRAGPTKRERDGSFPTKDHHMEHDWSGDEKGRPQPEQRRSRRGDSDHRDPDQRASQQWGCESQYRRERGAQRWDLDGRDGEQRWFQERNGGRHSDPRKREDQRIPQCGADPRNSEKRRMQQPDIDSGKNGEERGGTDPTGYEKQRSTPEREYGTSGWRRRSGATVFGGDQWGDQTPETREHVQVGRESGSQETDPIPELQREEMSRERGCDLDPQKGDPQKPQSSDGAADGGPPQRQSAESPDVMERPQIQEPENPGPEQTVRGSRHEVDQKRQTRSLEPQERDQRRNPKETGKSPTTECRRNRTRSRQSKLLDAPKTQRPIGREGTTSQSATPEPHQPSVWGASQEGGGGTPTAAEGGDTGGAHIQEAQPPLEMESPEGPEAPQNVGDNDGAQEEPQNKATPISNPWYEYMKAQKKSEEP